MDHHKNIGRQRTRRGWRVRNHLKRNSDRPRLAVHRSHKHMYVQLIDDAQGKTLAAASTLDQDLRSQLKYGGNVDAAKLVGKAIAERAKAAGVQSVYFDRREYKYHGRIKAVAEAAREAGLQF